eukprot:5376712-Pyramimonas_sp.AAC.1
MRVNLATVRAADEADLEEWYCPTCQGQIDPGILSMSAPRNCEIMGSCARSVLTDQSCWITSLLRRSG